MAMLTAVRYNPPIRDFYERVLSQGKRKKDRAHRLHAQVAHHAQAMVRDDAE